MGTKPSYQAVPFSGAKGSGDTGSGLGNKSTHGAPVAYYQSLHDNNQLDKIEEIGEPEQMPVELNLYSNVFSGAEVLQKFHNSVQYTSRFVWLNAVTGTIHMSQHMSKDRRHREANLAEVTDVVVGPPAKRKQLEGEDESIYSKNCLTINFKKGGGIDLQLKSEVERDEWLDALTKILLQLSQDSNHN